MNECFQALGKNSNSGSCVFQTYCKQLSPSPAALTFLCKKRIKKASILYVLEKTSIKQTIKEPKFLKKLWSCDGGEKLTFDRL